MMKTLTSSVISRRLAPALQALSTASQQPEPRQNFRTSETNPSNHTPDHLGQFYTIPSSDKKIFLYGGIPKSYETQTKTFNETCLMIRKPALDLINCLKRLDYTQPAVRFALYGKMGAGKSLTMAHVLHYGHKSGYLLVHLPWAGNWLRRCRECSSSETRDGFFDINVDAAAWLAHFKAQNEHLLADPALRTHADYVWSRRETTPKGAPLAALLDHGISRIKYASDAVVHLAEEIKRSSDEGRCRALVLVDGFNAFFHAKSRVFAEKKEVVHPHRVTPTLAFLSLTRCDWRNGAVVVTVDELAAGAEAHGSHLPRFLLGKDGFDHLDPFVPVSVDNYTEKEFRSCMDYYRERKWVNLAGEDGAMDAELAFLSGSNPFNLMGVCASL